MQHASAGVGGGGEVITWALILSLQVRVSVFVCAASGRDGNVQPCLA
jgi:hypothetical protein